MLTSVSILYGEYSLNEVVVIRGYLQAFLKEYSTMNSSAKASVIFMSTEPFLTHRNLIVNGQGALDIEYGAESYYPINIGLK